MENSIYSCPVCSFHLDGTSDDNYQEICPCCGTQFGYDDANTTHSALLERWISNGMQWYSESEEPPEGWNPAVQLSSKNH